ncbi:hypothetical protein Tco_0111707 [Tanacetum coccineum]
MIVSNGQHQAKADIGIFIGYAPKKKAYISTTDTQTLIMVTPVIARSRHVPTLFLNNLYSTTKRCLGSFVPKISVSPVPVAATPKTVDLADSPVYASIDQDAPSTSIPSS